MDSYGNYSRGNNTQSNGAAHLLSKPNSHGVPPHLFIFEYIDQPPTQDVFNEEILMAAWFYGVPILAENNRRDFVRYLYLDGCRPFSMNRVDKTKLVGDDLLLGGQPMQSKDILTSHENAIKTYIQRYVGEASKLEIPYRPEGEMGRMPFNETLVDWMKFDPLKRTAFDATISSGLAIMACNRQKYKPKERKVETKKVRSLFRKYNNSGNISTFIK